MTNKEAPVIVDALEEDCGSEDHEPKMTREQITAQIEALQKQLDAMPKVKRLYYNGDNDFAEFYLQRYSTHYFDVETINGVPHINGVAMKEVKK